MKLVDKILLEAISVSELERLTKIVSAYRDDIEKDTEWSEYKSCFKGTCQDYTDELEEILIDAGFKAIRTRGYYSDASDNFEPDTELWDGKDIEIFDRLWRRNGQNMNGLKFPHWWIEVGSYLIDVTADQFHPGEEDEYRYIIEKKPVQGYKKG